jgi:hypothetical protein
MLEESDPADHDGQHDRSEALFYYFRLEDQVPETHLLRPH